MKNQPWEMETSVTEVPGNGQTLSSAAAACHMDSHAAEAAAGCQSRETQQEVTATGGNGHHAAAVGVPNEESG